MNEHDTDTFARFARRFAGIEAEIQDPPALGRVRDGAVRLRRNVRSMSSVLAALAVVVVILVVAPFILSGPTDAPTSSVPATVGSASTPTPLVTTSTAPTGAAVVPLLPLAPLVPLDPVPAPEGLPGPCVTTETIDDRATTTIEQDTRMASAVLVGTVTGVGAARWNTADGLPPADPHPSASSVVRLLRVQVETVVKGAAGPVVTASIPGGVIVCDQFFVSWIPRSVEVGGRYVFFLGGTTRIGPESVSGVSQMWPIEGDQVSTRFEGQVSLATLIERATAAAR